MFDLVDTAFSWGRVDRLLIQVSAEFEGKGITSQLICKAHTAFYWMMGTWRTLSFFFFHDGRDSYLPQLMTNIIIHYQPCYFRYDPNKRVWRSYKSCPDLESTSHLQMRSIVKFSGLQEIQILLENPSRYRLLDLY